ncbi:MAG: glycosyltransferase family 2 protein [Verrucomicrobiales bacterium]|jgi:glycosyltransferase involved in cell wall biosynthesis|nr:glycosyltransferase family 2 protein [Verrucomicrobiales bacterium]
MPAYNEAGTVSVIVEKVLKQPCVRELVIVDDCSSDDTWRVLQQLADGDPRIRLHRHEVNQGKGAALRTAFRQVSAPVVIIQDADLEYDPAEYTRVIAPIVSGAADVVFGSRFIGSEEHRVLYFWHAIGNKFLSLLSNMLSNLTLTDMETCFKAFRLEILRELAPRLRENRFGFEPEITARVARVRPRLRIYEVAVSYHGRTYEEGKKIGWRDGCRAILAILRYNLLGR